MTREGGRRERLEDEVEMEGIGGGAKGDWGGAWRRRRWEGARGEEDVGGG
jgi:hypothetical protein